MHSLESIRVEVRSRLLQLGAAQGESLAESCLLQNNAYCGRRFMLGGFQAVWFFEENQVKFFGVEGELLASEQLGKPKQQLIPTRAKAA